MDLWRTCLLLVSWEIHLLPHPPTARIHTIRKGSTVLPEYCGRARSGWKYPVHQEEVASASPHLRTRASPPPLAEPMGTLRAGFLRPTPLHQKQPSMH